MPTLSLEATSRRAGYSTVSPVTHSSPRCCPAQASEKPTTGPEIGSLPTGPCRQGVAVMVIVSLPGASRVAVSPAAADAGAPELGRGLPCRKGRAPGRQQRPGRRVEVVAVVVMTHQDSVDPTQICRVDRRTDQLAGSRAPAEEVPLAGRIEGRIGQDAPTAELDERSRASDVGEPGVGHAQKSRGHPSGWSRSGMVWVSTAYVTPHAT